VVLTSLGVCVHAQGLIPRFLGEIFARIANPAPLASRPMDESTAVVCNPLVEGEAALPPAPGLGALTTVSFLEVYGGCWQLCSFGASPCLATTFSGVLMNLVGLLAIRL